MNENLKINKAGINLIKYYEGVYLKAYKCPAGVWTIGIGHTNVMGGFQIRPDSVITERQADEILLQDLEKCYKDVRELVKVPLDECQFSTLVSFIFNLGYGNLKSSTLLKLLNSGNYNAVPAQILRWNKCEGKPLLGLTRRRQAEADLWDNCGHGLMPQEVDNVDV